MFEEIIKGRQDGNIQAKLLTTLTAQNPWYSTLTCEKRNSQILNGKTKII